MVEFQRFFVIIGYQNFGTSPHYENPVFIIDLFFHHGLGLGHDYLVEQRQQRSILDGRIFHQDNDPHPGTLGVIGYIHAIFEIFD